MSKKQPLNVRSRLYWKTSFKTDPNRQKGPIMSKRSCEIIGFCIDEYGTLFLEKDESRINTADDPSM